MKRNAVAWAALVVATAALVSARAWTRPLPAAQEVPEEGQRIARSLSDAFGAVAEFVKPSVVQINVEKKGGLRLRGNNRQPQPGNPRNMTPKDFEEFLKKFFENGPNFERPQFGEGTGSGFVYDNQGHILTNNHVVNGADKITVTFHDGVEAEGKVVGVHPETDVAVIKVEVTSYPAVRIGSSRKLKVGEWVLALGSPFGLDQTVTAGIISATQRNDVGINRYESFIQTDAAINPGNSGGPLVDMTGRVVGINSAIATASRSNSGVGFTIPIDMAIRLADKLIKNGKITPALMGISIDPVSPALARQLGYDSKTKGLLVRDVGKDSPAERAGLKVGDIVTAFDGSPVTNRSDLQYLVTTSDIGKSYSLTYLRDRQEHKTTVSPVDAEKIYAGLTPRRPPVAESSPKPAAAKVNDFGLAVEPVTPELAKKYQYDDGAEGFVVTEVKEDSPAFVAGLEPGDRITAFIKDRKIQPAKSLSEFEQVAKQGDELAVEVIDVNKKLPTEFKILKKEKK
jgi:serine protease Do